MAFVEAIKGTSRKKVSRAFYESVLKPMGYRVNGEHTSPIYDTYDEEEVSHMHTTENEDIDLDTIPISDMTREQLKVYAEMHDIKVSGAKNVTEARKIIKEEMAKKNC